MWLGSDRARTATEPHSPQRPAREPAKRYCRSCRRAIPQAPNDGIDSSAWHMPEVHCRPLRTMTSGLFASTTPRHQCASDGLQGALAKELRLGRRPLDATRIVSLPRAVERASTAAKRCEPLRQVERLSMHLATPPRQSTRCRRPCRRPPRQPPCLLRRQVMQLSGRG